LATLQSTLCLLVHAPDERSEELTQLVARMERALEGIRRCRNIEFDLSGFADIVEHIEGIEMASRRARASRHNAE